MKVTLTSLDTRATLSGPRPLSECAARALNLRQCPITPNPTAPTQADPHAQHSAQRAIAMSAPPGCLHRCAGGRPQFVQSLPRARARRQRCLASEDAPNWNPQNTPNPQVMPSPTLSAREAVVVQLEAMKNNESPWPNHGIQTMYEFADDAGSMERSRYFGFSKDLYHQDHFNHGINQAAPALINCAAFTLLDGPPEPAASQQQQGQQAVQDLEPLPPGMEAVFVSVVDNTGAPGGVFELRMVQREAGLRKGCWMTKSCVRVQAP